MIEFPAETKFANRNIFLISILILCTAYFLFEIFYSYYMMLSVDEFWFTHWIYRYKSGLPYRDFSPYKTVLGYYLLLPAVLYSKSPLIFLKNVLAALNTCCFFVSGYWLKKFFHERAVLFTLALVMSAEFVLTYSTNIRVDFLAYWFCFFSVLLLFEKKYGFAGIILGLGFLTSQKAIWYIAASNLALFITAYSHRKNLPKTCGPFFSQIIIFNISIVCTLCVYIFIWSLFAGLKPVLQNVFYEAYLMYQLDWYAQARKLFWGITLTYNPFLFLFWPAALLCLSFKLENKIIFSQIYGASILVFLIFYKQVFPYYMTATVPAFLILYCGFFTWLFDPAEKKCFYPKLCLIFLIVYIGLFIWIAVNYHFPIAYGLIPCLAAVLILKKKYQPILLSLGILFSSCIYPLIFYSLTFSEKAGNYQKYNLTLAESLLKQGGNYLAGIELFYDKNQPVVDLRHLDGVAINYLYAPTEKLRSTMLSSLYRTPDATIDNAIKHLKQSDVKFYVNNYRIHALPPKIRNYLDHEYEHFWGSIYLYAPLFSPHQKIISLKFSGKYQLESANSISINGQELKPNSIMSLKQGLQQCVASQGFRLKLIPEDTPIKLDESYKQDQWQRVLG